MSLKEKINLVKEQLGISEVDTQALEKALGKKLVDYESVEALVAALMGYYNEELKKKANTSHTHDYAPSSHKHKKADISDFPTSMKNPYALSIQLNSGTAYTYDGAATKNINITPASIGAADSSHTHTKANITDFPTSMKNPYALEIKMNGQNPVSYDGAAAKSINITASGIGAEPAFKKNGAFNKNFGTTSNTVLDGAKLAEILGLTYGGSLNTSSAKTVNYAYYDSTTKKVYKCIKATSINYADANYFEAISNNDLLSKLQNLSNFQIREIKTNELIFTLYYLNNMIIGLKIALIVSHYRIGSNSILKDLTAYEIKESSVCAFAFRLKGSNDGTFYQIYTFKIINGIIYANTNNFTFYGIQ